jgi:uncharacterized protein YndB with AHSA1/START domain
MKSLVSEGISFEYEYGAPIDKVFAAISSDVGKWWPHRFHQGSTVGFEPRIGGRFFEEWGPGSAALYATVTLIEPPARLRLSGPMGMAGATACSLEYLLAAIPGGSRLSLVHDIFGLLDEDVVEDYRQGWIEILGTTLKAFLGGAKG